MLPGNLLGSFSYGHNAVDLQRVAHAADRHGDEPSPFYPWPMAWELAVEKAGDGKVTAAIVEKAVAELSDDLPATEVHTRKSNDPRHG